MRESLLVLIVAISAIAGNAQSFKYDGITYTVLSESDKTCELTNGNWASGDIEIPATVPYNNEEYAVIKIGDYAFRECKSLTSISLPPNLTTIGEDAFCSCSSLISIALSASLTTIQRYAFINCCSLTSISLPVGVTSIGASAFYNCSSLTSIEVADNNRYYRSIDGVLFTKDIDTLICCPGGKEGDYIVPEGVTIIGERAFGSCRLTSIILPACLTTIEERALDYCSSLTSIALPASLTTIGNYAFLGCISLVSINIPAGLISIGDEAFRGCSSLTSIALPASLTIIGEQAFDGCRSLTEITLPETVSSIGNMVFLGCLSLTSIDVAENNRNYSSIDGVLFTKDIETLICCPGGKEGAYVAPEGVTTIGDSSFRECKSLTSISLPDGVVSIGDEAFMNCHSLTSISLPSGLTTIGNWAFGACGSLTSIDLPSGLTTIGDDAFTHCGSLISIDLPSGLTTIGRDAFIGCSSLSVVNSYSTNPPVCDNDYVFSGLPTEATLHVPEGSKDAYAAEEGWSVFTNIVDDLVVENGIREIEAYQVANENETEIYNLQGRRMNVSGIDDLPAGIYIVGGRKVLVK